jgi:hypothetical protein
MVVLDCLLFSENNPVHVQLELEASLSFSCNHYIYIHKHTYLRIWGDNIKMDLQEVGGGRGGWIELVQDRDRWRTLVGTVRDFRVP